MALSHIDELSKRGIGWMAPRWRVGDESLFVCSRFSPFGIEFEWEVLLTDSYVEVGGADGNAKVSRDLLLRERASTAAAAATRAAPPPRFSAAFPLLQVPTSKCNSHENQLWLCVSLWHDLVPMTRIRVRVRVICMWTGSYFTLAFLYHNAPAKWENSIIFYGSRCP